MLHESIFYHVVNSFPINTFFSLEIRVFVYVPTHAHILHILKDTQIKDNGNMM